VSEKLYKMKNQAELSMVSPNPKCRTVPQLDLWEWTGRVYLVKIDYWILIFQSTNPANWIWNRFSPFGVPVYIYAEKKGRYYLPVPLQKAIEDNKVPLF
jgi:hypothetical protein